MPRNRLSSLIRCSLASLPPAAGLATGTSFEITNYGGNIATVVNGVWRFEYPFRTTWAGRPAVGLVAAGTELQVTDYSNQKFISDGANWRPAQGRALIAQKHGTIAAPVAVLSAVAAGVFAIPGGQITVPAGMITPHSRLAVNALSKKTGATASFFFGIKLGTTGTSSDSLIGGLTSNAATGAEVSVNTSARVGDPTLNTFVTMNTVGDGSTVNTTNTSLVQSTNLNHSADQRVSLYVASGNAADVYNLIGYTVTLEA